MKKRTLILSGLLALQSLAFAEERIPNEAIDNERFIQIVTESVEAREQNRLTELEFLAAMQSKEYILFDARSNENYALRHIRGAINLPFTEFTAEKLAAVIPSKDSKILIYCNNNFRNGGEALLFKTPPASLNLNTQASLRAYGYQNIYELGPFIDFKKTILPFEGTQHASEGNRLAAALELAIQDFQQQN